MHVFLPPPELARFVALVHEIGRERDLDWISVDPLVPLGPQATATVQGLPVPRPLIDDNREGGVLRPDRRREHPRADARPGRCSAARTRGRRGWMDGAGRR